MVRMDRSSTFTLKLRIPGWFQAASVEVNGTPATVVCVSGTWAELQWTWNPGDRIEIRIPLPLRLQAVDRQHPHRVAVVRGPVVLVQDGFVHEPILKLPDNDDGRNKWLVPDEKGSAAFRFIPSDGRNVMAEFRPFYSVGADTYNRMYFDLDDLPVVPWQQKSARYSRDNQPAHRANGKRPFAGMV
jgi:DUF1680 family protein